MIAERADPRGVPSSGRAKKTPYAARAPSPLDALSFEDRRKTTVGTRSGKSLTEFRRAIGWNGLKTTKHRTRRPFSADVVIPKRTFSQVVYYKEAFEARLTPMLRYFQAI